MPGERDSTSQRACTRVLTNGSQSPNDTALPSGAVDPPTPSVDLPPPSIARLQWTRLRRILDAIRNVTYGPIMPGHPANPLREHGVPAPARRLAVLRAVSGRPHCTTDDVAADVRVEIGAISRQAVYDALGILAEAGLSRRILPPGRRPSARIGSVTTTTTSFVAPADRGSTSTASSATPRALPAPTTRDTRSMRRR